MTIEDLRHANPVIACIWEATARKVGNVHPGTGFSGTEYVHFLISAAVFREAQTLAVLDRKIGNLINLAVEATRTATGQNTNLGIILLLAPLIKASDEALSRQSTINVLNFFREYNLGPIGLDEPTGPTEFRQSVQTELNSLDISDAELAFKAVRLANPGGLGAAPEQDVRDEPTVTLLEAMKLAADRDLIARQYANGFADVFDFGVPAFLEGLERFNCVEAAIIHSQLRWLAEYPDSLIARKNGPAAAEDIRRRAAEVLRFGGLATPEGRATGVALDKHLRSDGNKLNPGTTADLIAACLFVALRENKVSPSAPFRWNVPDWL